MSTIRVPRKKTLDTLKTRGWVQGKWGDLDGDGPLCLHGAIRVCCPRKGDAYLIEQVAARKGWGIGWNDTNGRTFDDIEQCLTDNATVTDADLADTFGPQWEHVVALVRRAAELTREEAQRLAAARAATWAAAGDAAAWDAAGAAAGAAAWDAAGDAAGAAAGAAARAVVVRDLIGQHGFTQEQYDRLTAPWREVIGPVHPEDAS